MKALAVTDQARIKDCEMLDHLEAMQYAILESLDKKIEREDQASEESLMRHAVYRSAKEIVKAQKTGALPAKAYR